MFYCENYFLVKSSIFFCKKLYFWSYELPTLRVGRSVNRLTFIGCFRNARLFPPLFSVKVQFFKDVFDFNMYDFPDLRVRRPETSLTVYWTSP